MIAYWTCLCTFLLVSSSSSSNLLEVCQSGIRDDGTNYVHCARKSLTEIPAFASNRLFNLAFDELILSDNSITHIEANAFQGLRIKRLIMSGNHLQSIDRNAFRELENYLEEFVVEFDPSIVDTIPHAIKSNLANLRSLTLIGLHLQQLPANSFAQMKKLESLALKSCRMQRLESNAFQSLEQQLRHLYLDSNLLTSDIFPELHRLIHLESLSLSHNFIDQLSMKFINKNLRYLDLSYNRLTKLVLLNLNNLQVLNLQNNLLTSEHIHGTWPNQLKELILDFNGIHTFERNSIDRHNALEVLSLQSNDFLLTNANVFEHFHRLKKLNLARNNIQIIPHGLFNSTRSLEDLTLDRNPFLPLAIETFSGLEQSLRNLSCQSCSLTSQSLPALSRLLHLERFKFQSNFFTEVQPDDFFSSMSQLLLIDLQRNQLTHLPSTLPQSLRELQLGNNRLTQFPPHDRTLAELSQLNTLDLSQNPLHCDCHLQSLHRWLLAHFQTELVPYVQWICATPVQLAGRKLGSLSPADLTCVEITNEIPRILSSFNVWLKDSETAILEWLPLASVETSLELIVVENSLPLPILHLNNTENYFLLEKLKPTTNYSFCLRIQSQSRCSNLTTRTQKILSLSSKQREASPPGPSDVEYLIIALSLGIVLILVVLFFLIVFLFKYRPSSKTPSIESYYQTTGSETTQIGTCNHSLEDRSIHSLKHPSPPMFCTCHLSANYGQEQCQTAYHLYQEIPFYRPPTII